jgi:nucleoid DNA-binding protein
MAKGKREVIQLLATEYNLPLKEVNRIVASQLMTVAETISAGSFDSVRLPRFGLFSSKESRRECLAIAKKKNDAKRKSFGAGK